MLRFLRTCFLVLLVFPSASVRSQDFTFSQFALNYHVFNPASIGHIDSDVRVVATYRNQWFASGFPYQTFLASGEWKINPFPKKLKQAGVSLSIADDQVGDGQWRNTWINAGLSATKELDAAHRHHFSVGVSTAMLMRQFNAKNLVFENQFESSSFEFNPAISSGEGLEATKQTFFQVNSGIRYDFAVTDRLAFGVGASALWLYRPIEALSNFSSDGVSRMNSRVTGLFTARWKFTDDLWIDPQCFFSQQGKAREFNFGGWLVFSSHLENKGLWQTGFGLFCRLGDSMIPAIRLGNERIYGQLSYDATFSGVKNTDVDKKFIGMGGMGALEFSLVYGLNLKAKPYRTYPVPCQTF